MIRHASGWNFSVDSIVRRYRNENFFADVVHAKKKLRLQLDLAMNFSTRDVAVKSAFESKGLKPGYHFIGSRVETGRFRALWGNWIQLSA
jgi:hypothetical protein